MQMSRRVVANCYDYPHYYDIAFQAHTQREADFIEAVCRKHCPFAARRFLEPACGTGRLVRELAARGYRVTGFDLSRPALSYLRRHLGRSRLKAKIFEADMSDFRLRERVDAAYCTVNTFRHLLTDRAARNHLECVADSVRLGGIYVLGSDLLPSLDVKEEETVCWTQRRGETRVTVTLRVLHTDRRRRTKNLQGCLLARRGSKKLQLRYQIQSRTYTAKQFTRLLRSVPSLQLCKVYDFRYDIEQASALNDQMTYGVFVLRRRLRP